MAHCSVADRAALNMHDSVAMFSIRCMGTVEDVWRLRHLPMATIASHSFRRHPDRNVQL